MKTIKKLILSFLFVIPFFYGNFSYSQNEKKIDSLIKATSVKIYEKPDEVIAVGKK